MKKISVILLLIPFLSTAQISEKSEKIRVTIGEDKYMGTVYTRLYYTVSPDTVYYLMFKNEKYKTISDYKLIPFVGSETVGLLYDRIKSAFTIEGEQTVDFTLGDTPMSIGRAGKVFFISAKGGFFSISEKSINKLFGR